MSKWSAPSFKSKWNELIKGILVIPATVYGKPVLSVATDGFTHCNKLEKVLLPEGLIQLSQGAFEFCRTLVYVKLPKTLEVIGQDAFFYTSVGGLRETIEIPASCEFIQEGAFAWCENIDYIGVDTKNPNYVSRGGCLVRKSDNTVIRGSNFANLRFAKKIGYDAFSYTKQEVFDIPESVKEISSNAFSFAAVKKVIIPESITKIKYACFYQCKNLESLSLPEGLIEIGSMAFNECTNLSKLTIPSTVKTIGYGAFGDCERLKEIYIPKSVDYVGCAAFGIFENLDRIYASKTKAQAWDEEWLSRGRKYDEEHTEKIVWYD